MDSINPWLSRTVLTSLDIGKIYSLKKKKDLGNHSAVSLQNSDLSLFLSMKGLGMFFGKNWS